MVNPLRTTTIVPNVAIPNSLTHLQQFQEGFFRLKDLFVLGGGTILISNSGALAGAGDNIPNAAAVGTGLAGTGAWYVVEFATFGGAAEAVRLLVYVNDNAAPFQIISYRIGNATWSGGNTTTLPTLGTGFATSASNITLHPYTDVRNCRISTWRTTNVGGAQSFKFLFKEEGINLAAGTSCTFITLDANSNASGGGTLGSRWWINATQSTSSSNFSGSQANGVNGSGTASQQPSIASSLWSIATGWTSGVDSSGATNHQPPLVGTTTGGRFHGAWVDLFAIPAGGTVGNFTDTSETGQTQRRMNFGGIALFWPTGTSLL